MLKILPALTARRSQKRDQFAAGRWPDVSDRCFRQVDEQRDALNTAAELKSLRASLHKSKERYRANLSKAVQKLLDDFPELVMAYLDSKEKESI